MILFETNRIYDPTLVPESSTDDDMMWGGTGVECGMAMIATVVPESSTDDDNMMWVGAGVDCSMAIKESRPEIKNTHAYLYFA